jgi:hypothetical protein
METTHISDLGPEQREAAEKLLGRSLASFQKVAIKVLEGGGDIVVRFFCGKQEKKPEPPAGSWDIPTCFNVLTDFSDEERADYDATLSLPVKLSHSHEE